MIVRMLSGMGLINLSQDMTSGSTQKQIQKKEHMFKISVLGAGKLLEDQRGSMSLSRNKYMSFL